MMAYVGHESGTTGIARARIFTRLWRSGIDTNASIPPAFVAWRAGTIKIPARIDRKAKTEGQNSHNALHGPSLQGQ
jgi:hypothetical protein